MNSTIEFADLENPIFHEKTEKNERLNYEKWTIPIFASRPYSSTLNKGVR